METVSNGTSNGTSNRKPSPPSVVLDKAKETFEARKSPANQKEVVAALGKYLRADEEVAKAEKALTEAKAKRTAAVQELVALRGTGIVGTNSRGQGRIMARGDSAWISFAKEDAETYDI